MKNLEDYTILVAVINDNKLGGYFLEICNENMEKLFVCDTVKLYADYVRLNRRYIDSTLWFAKEDVSLELQNKVQDEVSKYNDVFVKV